MKALRILALLLIGTAAPAAAQVAAPCLREQAAGTDTTSRRPDLRIVASATAEEVRFESTPRIRIVLLGCAPLDSVRTLERRNLPRPVQPGVTYRDVAVGVEITSHLRVECLLPALADTTRRPPGGRPGPLSADSLRAACATILGDTARARTPVRRER